MTDSLSAVGRVAFSGASISGSALWAAGSYVAAKVAGDQQQRLTQISVAPPTVDDGHLRGMGSAELLRVANTLSGIFTNVEAARASGKLRSPEVPRLVVVGTQSSGKSSLLNGLMAADILPLGEQMVTRAPLNLQLIHTPDPAEMRAEFGQFVDGCWQAAAKIPLSCPDPTDAQLLEIRKSIDAQTDARAGSQKAVSSEPIFMRFSSPYVPNLSLVDLPGLTMTALTDQGQPKDIKAQIRAMIGEHIAQERTIILMVCAARPDLEADPALELVKEYDPHGTRTVGVLTKIDLMNAGTDVLRYLSGSVPSDLQLALGYFAVRNRSPAESKGANAISVREGFGSEAAYFKAHPVYGGSEACRARLGVPHLSRFLSRVLLQHLRQHLPAILAEVTALASQTERELALLGPQVPTDEASKASLIQTMTASFCRDFTGALVEKRADVKTGRKIKDAFIELQAQLRAVTPFDAAAFSDAYLVEAVRDCEGVHLSFPIPPIELLEHMLNHPEQTPIRQLLPPCTACLQSVHDELRAMSNKLLLQPPFERFPSLQLRMREEMDGMLSAARAAAQTKLEDLVEMEEAYISTDDEKFLAELSAAVKKLVSRLDAALLRSILASYFATVVRSVCNGAPKAIMLFMVRAAQERVYQYLFERVAQQPAANLLDEPLEMESKRRAEVELLAKLKAARGALEALSTR